MKINVLLFGLNTTKASASLVSHEFQTFHEGVVVVVVVVGDGETVIEARKPQQNLYFIKGPLFTAARTWRGEV